SRETALPSCGNPANPGWQLPDITGLGRWTRHLLIGGGFGFYELAGFKHFARCHRILLAHQNTEQGVGEGHRDSLNRHRNTCGLQSALCNVGISLRSTDLSNYELPFGCLVDRVKNFVGSGGVLIADQQLEPETTPRQMIAHTASSISLDHRVDASRFEEAFRNVGLALSSE